MIVCLGLVLLVLLLPIVNLGCSGLLLRRMRSLLHYGVLLCVVAVAPIVVSGCAGFVSGANTTGNPPPPPALNITNVQVASATTSTCQIVWTTNVAADSAVDYGTSSSYGSSTPIDSAMVTSHQVTLSGLAAGATYYYQVSSTDSKNDHGKSGGHTFKTSGFSIAGAISPAAGGSGATVTLSGGASTTTTADSLGNYTFGGLANGTYTVAPSHAGYTFTPSSQSTTVNGANVAGVNFADSATPVAPTITTQPANQTVTAGQTATFSVTAVGTAPLRYQWYRSSTVISGAASASYTTGATSSSDNGAQFAVVVSNTAGNVTSSAATLTVNPALVSIAVTPANPSINKGATQQFTATGRFSDSSTQVLSNAVWASGTPGVATINATGLATAVGAGTSTISATIGSISGATLLTVNPAPALGIQVSPTSINFGNAVVSTSLSQALIITNTGTATLSITQVTETGSAFFSVSGFSLPLNVTAGKQTTITVTFLPTSVGSVSGNVSIVSNAPTSPTSVGLSGAGIAATHLLGANPTSLNFGNVSVGNTGSLTAALTNNGNSNVTISGVTVTGAEFSASGVSAGTILTPTQSITLNMGFAPTAAGSVTGGVSVASDATNSPSTIAVSGSGQPSASGQWITGYYAAQNGAQSPSNIPWNKYTHIIHFAAGPGVDAAGNGNGTVTLLWLTQAEINAMIAARPAGKKVLVSIKDNDFHLSAFPQNTSPAMIGTFVSNIVSFVNTNQYDGVDIDWELNTNVTQYVDLLARLRNAMPTKVITMASGNWGGLPSVGGASYSQLDQINVMCYDMDNPAIGYSFYNDALLQAGNPSLNTCDWRVGAISNAGVPASKIGVGIPFYGRRWPGVTRALVTGSFTTSTVFYRNLATDATRWQPQYQFYDSVYKADYLSIPGLTEFDSYTGTQFIGDAVAWGRAKGFGGFMTFATDHEYLSSRLGDSRYPLSTALCQDVFGTCP